MTSGILSSVHKLPIMTEGRDQILQSNSSQVQETVPQPPAIGREGSMFTVKNRRKQMRDREVYMFLEVSEDAHLPLCPSFFEVWRPVWLPHSLSLPTLWLLAFTSDGERRFKSLSSSLATIF